MDDRLLIHIGFASNYRAIDRHSARHSSLKNRRIVHSFLVHEQGLEDQVTEDLGEKLAMGRVPDGARGSRPARGPCLGEGVNRHPSRSRLCRATRSQWRHRRYQAADVDGEVSHNSDNGLRDPPLRHR
jgi:hypothetical protein